VVEELLAGIRGSLGLPTGRAVAETGVGATISSGYGSQVQPTCDLLPQGNLRDSLYRYLDQKRHEVTPQHLKGIEFILRGFVAGGYSLTRGGLSLRRSDLLAGGRTVTTVNQHLLILTAFARWAGVGEGLEGLRLKSPKGRRRANEREAFSDEEMTKILRGLRYAWSKPSQLWLPLIMAYTGARPEEVCQLRCQDIYAHEGSVLVFDFSTMDDNQRRKNESSRRLVPVHSAIKTEVLKLRSQGEGPLFPELNAGHNGRLAEAPSRWFNRRLLRDRLSIKDSRKVLYSLRHTVATKLKHQGVEESLISELLGHSNHSITTGRYGKSYPIKNLVEVVELLDWRI